MRDGRLLLVYAAEAHLVPDSHLRAQGWDVHHAADLETAARLATERPFAVGLMLASAADMRRCAVLEDFLAAHDGIVWIGVFEPDALDAPACRDLVLDHCFDHHTAPVDAQRLGVVLGHAHGHALLRQARRADTAPRDHAHIVGQSEARRTQLLHIKRIAKVDAPVLISGESGSGKEVAAQAIHQASARAGGPFVAINCGAIQPALIQSELFGHAKGSFTGAIRDKRGLFEEADGGTVFLDEIGDLPLELQVNLLRVLQEGTLNRVGSTQSLHVDVRVIAATHRNLERAVAAGSFREDLYYRLNVLSLHVAPLRERKADIEPLAHYFFAKFASEKSPRLKGFTRRALMRMEAHAWPGNVRELINRVRRAMVMADGKLITPVDLGLDEPSRPATRELLDDTRSRAERSAIEVSLSRTRKNVTLAATELGVSRMTLYRLMAKHGIDN